MKTTNKVFLPFYSSVIKDRKDVVIVGYNELGFNKYSVIMNKIFSSKWPFQYTNLPGNPVVTKPGHNEQIWSVLNCSL